jgi:hypothetical protein
MEIYTLITVFIIIGALLLLVRAYIKRDIRCPNCGECAKLINSKQLECTSCGHLIDK